MALLDKETARQLFEEQGKDIKIPDGYTALQYDAFLGYDITSIELNGIKRIGEYAFYNGILSDIKLPKGVSVIGRGAFADNKLTQLTIPENVTTIGADAFLNNKLTALKIPKTLTTLRSGAFQNNKLKTMEIEEGRLVIDAWTFSYNNLKEVSLPSSITTIGNGAFAKNKLKKLDLHEGITEIGNYAFAWNPLQRVTIPESVVRLGKKAFDPNTELHKKTKQGTEKIILSIDSATSKNEISTFKLFNPIERWNRNVNKLTIGTDKSDIIYGTAQGEILAGKKGKNVMTGMGGPDGFFIEPEKFGRKYRDKITDFKSEEGDSIMIDKIKFELCGVIADVDLISVNGKAETKAAAKTDSTFIYDTAKGLLYFNKNESKRGWGSTGRGGLFLKLKGSPKLDINDIIFLEEEPVCLRIKDYW